jgi:hypothetical protein
MFLTYVDFKEFTIKIPHKTRKCAFKFESVSTHAQVRSSYFAYLIGADICLFKVQTYCCEAYDNTYTHWILPEIILYFLKNTLYLI